MAWTAGGASIAGDSYPVAKQAERTPVRGESTGHSVAPDLPTPAQWCIGLGNSTPHNIRLEQTRQLSRIATQHRCLMPRTVVALVVPCLPPCLAAQAIRYAEFSRNYSTSYPMTCGTGHDPLVHMEYSGSCHA